LLESIQQRFSHAGDLFDLEIEMSKKAPHPKNDESFDDASAGLNVPSDSIPQAKPQPIPATPAVALSPLDAFFEAVCSREPNQTSLSRQAKTIPNVATHVDSKGFNALTLAMLSRKNELAKILVEMGSDVNLTSKSMGWCPLVVAAGFPSGEDALARAMLAKGANPSSKTHDGLYALTSACTYGNLLLAKTLLDAGAEAAPKDASWLPIVAAAGSGNVDLVNLLVERGANPNQPLGERNGFRSIHQASKAGHADIVVRLVALGVDLNSMDNEGNTPLHFASQRADQRTISILLKAGANPSLENVSGKIPADLASLPAVAKTLAPKNEQRIKHPLSGKAKKILKDQTDGDAPSAKKASKKAPAPAKVAKKTISKAMQALTETAAKKIAPAKKKKAATKEKPASKAVVKKIPTVPAKKTIKPIPHKPKK
jgi:ankyrin repeat protein